MHCAVTGPDRQPRLAAPALVPLLALAVVLGAAPLHAAPVARWDVAATLTADGTLRVGETAALDPAWERGARFTRVVFAPVATEGALLHAPFEELAVADGAGAPLPHRVWRYGRERHAVAVDLPAGGADTLRLSYALRRVVARAVEPGVDVLDWPLFVGGPGRPVDALTVHLALPPGVSTLDAVVEAVTVGDEVHLVPAEDVRRGADGLRVALGPLAEGASARLTVRFPTGAVAAAGPWAPDVARQTAPLPWVLGAVVLLAGLLRLLPVRLTVPALRVWHALLAAVFLWLQGGLVLFWFGGRPDLPGAELWSNAVAELVGAAGLAAFVLLYLWRQARDLRPGNRAAYYLEVAAPVVLLATLPFASVEPGFALLVLLAVPIPLVCLRRRLALRQGAASHLVVERVATEGEVALPALARSLGLPAGELGAVLRAQPDLPLVTDHEHGVVWSAAAAGQREGIAVCPTCGGATQTGGMDLVACRYCHREFAQSRAARPERPVPVLVEALARLPEMAAAVVLLWGGLLAVSFVLIAVIEPDESLGEALLLGAIVAALGAGAWWALRRAAAALRAGRGYGVLRALLLLGSPLALPLLAWRGLGSRRVRLHFGRLDPAAVEREVDRRGELSFAELAAFLGTRLDEAVEVARHLAGNDRIAAVFDRVGGRLVARRLYAALAREGSCRRCGGILGVAGGVVTCQFCGTAPGAVAR